MSDRNILLVCSAGMSTSMLVLKMQEVAKERQLDYNIKAVSASEADNEIENVDLDILLLGPQVQYMKDQFVEKGKEHGFVVDVIDMGDYGLMNGANVLDKAIELMEA